MGWIDDTYFPWVWSYRNGNWYYLYATYYTEPAYEGYWIFFYTPDGNGYGWGYIVPGMGWWYIDHGMSAIWIDLGDPMPAG